MSPLAEGGPIEDGGISFACSIERPASTKLTLHNHSGADDSALGSLLELSWKGTREVGPLPDGSTRKFLKDGDKYVQNKVGWRVACDGRHALTVF